MNRTAFRVVITVGAVLLALIMLAGNAKADNSQDVQFLALLQQHDIESNALGIPLGHAVCTDVDAAQAQGVSLRSALINEVRAVYRVTPLDFDMDHSISFVAAALLVYCPWDLPADTTPMRYAV
jgi:hypothetical protein